MPSLNQLLQSNNTFQPRTQNGLERSSDILKKMESAAAGVSTRFKVPGFGTKADAYDKILGNAKLFPSTIRAGLVFHVRGCLQFGALEHTCTLKEMTHGRHHAKEWMEAHPEAAGTDEEWVYDGSGLCRRSNRYANRELVRRGLLKVTRVRSKNNKIEKTRYAIQWEELKKFIAEQAPIQQPKFPKKHDPAYDRGFLKDKRMEALAEAKKRQAERLSSGRVRKADPDLDVDLSTLDADELRKMCGRLRARLRKKSCLEM